MKTNLKILTLASTCMLVMSSAHAYKYVIYTDDNKTDKAEQVSDMIKTTYPFSKFDIEVEIVRLQPHELECSSKYGIDRLIMCDNADDIQRRAMLAGGDQAMIIKDTEKYGGSSQVGGGVPVMTTAGSARVMLHEYMHTLGLCDEYEYAASEAVMYCGGAERPNLVFIDPLDPYAADSMARARHMGQIPWFGDINTNTPITNTGGTRLGTGDVDFGNKAPANASDMPQALSEPTGLYRGKICNQAVPKKISWHPGAGATIMENTEAGLGAPLEKIVEKMLVSKGAKMKLQYQDEVEDKEPLKTEEAAGSVVVKPEPLERINNTARSFFKSFFSWAQDAIESIKRVFDR
jgi:hypothetical protein